VQAAQHEERARDQSQLDDLGIAEVPPEPGDRAGVDRRVIPGEPLGEVEGRRLGRRSRGLPGELRQ
jgi:hypothetical protein